MWLPLTFAMNSLNRSMGLPDTYPFVINDVVKNKLAFIHRLIRKSATS
ncbi:MAG: putative zinc-binding metallopeptidase [Flavihumibacter sp.]